MWIIEGKSELIKTLIKFVMRQQWVDEVNGDNGIYGLKKAVDKIPHDGLSSTLGHVP